jgi:hypothetical protein
LENGTVNSFASAKRNGVAVPLFKILRGLHILSIYDRWKFISHEGISLPRRKIEFVAFFFGDHNAKVINGKDYSRSISFSHILFFRTKGGDRCDWAGT